VKSVAHHLIKNKNIRSGLQYRNGSQFPDSYGFYTSYKQSSKPSSHHTMVPDFTAFLAQADTIKGLTRISEACYITE
jgi:hypothetical protein